MIKLALLMVFMMTAGFPLRAQLTDADDQEFSTMLDKVKNPFDDGLPKPPPVVPKAVERPAARPQPPRPVFAKAPRPTPVKPAPVVLPEMRLQGVMVGDDMHDAIINDQAVSVGATVDGVTIKSVTKEGVELLYKGKKFFLKVD